MRSFGSIWNRSSPGSREATWRALAERSRRLQSAATAYDAAASDAFASFLAASDDALIVGAPFDDDNGVNSGSAYIFNAAIPCDGDSNGDGVVDVNDISFVLFALGDPCPNPGCPGDANNDGVIDVNDISFVLFSLGDPCP